MPGPALNPIATSAPVAAAKNAGGPRPDAATEAGAPDAPEQGFATELKRQMQGERTPDEAANADARATAASDEAAQPGDDSQPTQPPVPPDLAALLAATAAGAAQPAGPAREPQAPEPASGSAAIAPSANPGVGDATGNIARGPTDPAADAANLAGRPAAQSGVDSESAGSGKPPLPEPGVGDAIGARPGRDTGADALAAAPTNNFAAIHAAALANLRGESPQPASSPVPLHVATPAGTPGWPEEVGNRVTWMVGQSESHAELTLTPPQLGKVEVSITVSGEQTSAQIVAATPAARELIEQSLPRLREVLAQSGINLGQTDVGTSGQPGGSGEGRRGDHRFNPSRGGGEAVVGGSASGPWQRRAEGLVDTFA